jgi:hypothetical protein
VHPYGTHGNGRDACNERRIASWSEIRAIHLYTSGSRMVVRYILDLLSSPGTSSIYYHRPGLTKLKKYLLASKIMAGLARHVDPDELIKTLQDHPMHKAGGRRNQAVTHTTPYSSRYAASTELSKFRIPHDGAPADVVHQLLKDELDLDGRPNLNLASFVGTYMEKGISATRDSIGYNNH